MADNANLTAGDGTIVAAADDIGGVKYPRVKATWGPDGTANDADVANGKPLPVQLRDSDGTDVSLSGKVGSLTETAPATDTASSGLNGRLQRIAQRLSSLIALLPTALGAGGGFKVDGSGTALPVSGTVTANAGTGNHAITAASGSIASGAIASGAVASGAFASGAIADGADVTIGAKADAKSTATDTTAITAMSVWKQISASVQTLAGAVSASKAAITIADGDDATLGAKADAKNTATDTTSISAMSVWKQISSSVQALVTALGSTALDLGSGTGGSRTLRTMLDTTQVASLLDCSTTVTRPADTSAYAPNDTWANSTSSPTAGGFTFTNAGAASGSGGIVTDAVIVSSAAPGTLLQGEIWIFDSAVTAVNDNAAFSLSDSDALLYLGKIPFTLAVEATNNSSAHVTGLNIGFHCVGTANLRFLIKVLNAYTPVSAETLTARIKGIRS